MPVRSSLLLALTAALLAPAAAGQPAALPAPTRVAAPDGQVFADVYADLSAEEAERLLDALGLAPASGPGGAVLTLDVGVAPEADNLQAVAFTPSHDRVLTANAATDNLAVLDVATGATLAIVPVGDNPTAVAATDDVAVVACRDSGEVYLVDLDTYAVRAVVPGVPYAAGVRILPGGTRALVASILGHGARVLDLATGAVVVEIPSFPYDGLELTITYPALRLYYRYQPLVASVTGDTLFALAPAPAQAVMRFDAATGAALGAYPTDFPARSFNLSADGSTLVVGDLRNVRAFQAIDVATGARGPVCPLPGSYVGLVTDFAVSADGARVLTGLRLPNGTGQIAAVIPLDGAPPTLLATRNYEFASNASPDGRLALGVGLDGAAAYDFETGSLDVLTPGRWYVAAGFSSVGPRWGGVPINHPGEVASILSAEGTPAHLGDLLPGGPIEGDSPQAIGLPPGGGEALVANVYTSAITRVDLASKAVTAVVPLANVNPIRIEALWDDLALVHGTDSTGVTETAVLFDLAAGAEAGRLPAFDLSRMARGVEPNVFASSDAGALVRLRATTAGLEVVAATADSLVARWAVSRDGALVAVGDTTHHRVQLYDGAAGALLGQFDVPDVELLAASPDGRWAFAASETDGLIRRYAVSGATVTEEEPIACGCGVPEMLEASEALVAAVVSPVVYLFDAATGAPAGTVVIPEGDVTRVFLTDAGEVVALTTNPNAVHLPGYTYALANRPTDFVYAPDHGLALALDKPNDALVIGDLHLVGVEPGPAVDALALRIAPNPARGAFRAEYTWAGPPATAELTVYDLLGRLVGRVEAPAPGPGRHALTWGDAASLPSGVYLARLRVGDQAAQARVTVVR